MACILFCTHGISHCVPGSFFSSSNSLHKWKALLLLIGGSLAYVVARSKLLGQTLAAFGNRIATYLCQF